MAKPKRPTKADKLRAAQKDMERALRRCAVTHLIAKGVKAAKVPFPDLACAREGLAPMSQRPSPNGFKRVKVIAVPEGFHIGHSHKQGPQIHSNREVEWTGGKKTG